VVDWLVLFFIAIISGNRKNSISFITKIIKSPQPAMRSDLHCLDCSSTERSR